MPEACKKKKNKHISHILRFAVAAAAIYLAFRGEDIRQIADVLLEMNLWFFVLAMAIFILAQCIFTLRWSILMRVQSVRVRYWLALRLHFLGLFYNNCLPGSVGGDLLRIWYVTKHTDKKLEAALSVFVDRVVGLTGMIIMAFTCYWFIPVQGQSTRFAFPYEINFLQKLTDYKWILSAIGAVFLVVVIMFFIFTARGRSLLRRAVVLAETHGLVILRKIAGSIRIYCNHIPTILTALILTFILQGICIVAIWLLGRELGVTAHVKYYFIFFPVSLATKTWPCSALAIISTKVLPPGPASIITSILLMLL